MVDADCCLRSDAVSDLRAQVLTFKNFKEDFGFDLNYGNLSRVPASDMLSFGSENISSYNLTEVKAAFEGHDDDDEKGVKVRDDSAMSVYSAYVCMGARVCVCVC